MKEYRYFATANTGDGFVNYLGQINGDDFLFILKGSSGSGKNTFMKQVGEYFKNKGFSIEYFFCSSDVLSLDGIRIVEKKVAIVDGTAPHILNGEMVGVNSQIINFEEFVDLNVKKNESVLRKLIEAKKNKYENYYKYLNLIKLENEIEKIAFNEKYVQKKVDEILKIIPQKKSKNPLQRNLFFNALSYYEMDLENQNIFDKVVDLNCELFDGFEVLKRIKNYCIENKISFDAIWDNFNKNNLISLKINSFLIKNGKNKQKTNIKYKICAKKEIREALKIHSEIEKIYGQFIDFDKVKNKKNEVIKIIEEKF